MKRQNKGCLIFLLAWILSVFMFSETADAAENKAVLRIKDLNGAYEVLSSSQTSDSDLFPSFKELMPGDVCTQQIEIQNACVEKEDVHLYLSAVVPVFPEKDPEYDGKETEPLSLLKIKVWNGKTLLFDDTADISISEAIDLGTIPYRDSAELKVELEVPVELNNEQTERVAETEWTFQVEGGNTDNSEGGTNGTGGGSTDHSAASSVQTPQTGDGSNAELWMLAFIASLAAAGYVLYVIKTKKVRGQ